MLEDELTHILSEDRKLHQLILADSAEIRGLARKLSAQNRPYIVADIDRISKLVKKQRNPCSRSCVPTRDTRILDAVDRLLSRVRGEHKDTVVAHVLNVELHADPELLKEELCKNVERMASFSDGILVLYGVCDSLRELEVACGGCTCPLYFLTDKDGTKVEDCIALALGGNDARWHTPLIHRGIVFYLTPKLASWAMSPARQTLLNSYTRRRAKMDQQLIRNIERLLKRTRFKKVAKLDTGLRYEPNFDENVQDYAQLRKLEVIPLTGSTDIVERCYQRAKTGIRVQP